MILIALFPAGDCPPAPLETRYTTNPKLPEHLDGIIVISGGKACALTGLRDQVNYEYYSVNLINISIFLEI